MQQNMLINIAFAFLSALCVHGRQYLLSPKQNQVHLQMSLELGLRNLIHNEHISVFTTSEENVQRLKHTLNYFYDIEEDQEVSLNNNGFELDIDFSKAPWHLDRIARRNLPLEGSYNFSNSGSCHFQTPDTEIYTYIVDTGIDVKHSEFENRAFWGNNFADNKDVDCNNHGTHVAGLIGSKNYGVCKDATMVAVKVLDCQGSGTFSSIIKGLDWVLKHHNAMSKTKKTKSIINMSLGGGYSKLINKLSNSIVDNNDNMYMVVAAGNEDSDACTTSPASASSVLTVMASDKNDDRAWFSNWGKCADIYSPGVDILSSIPNERVAVYSGTSMSSPVAVGVLNHYLDMFPNMNMKEIKEQLKKDASKQVINGKRSDTSNDLIFLNRNIPV